MVHSPNFLHESPQAELGRGLWIWILAILIAAALILPLAVFGGRAAAGLIRVQNSFKEVESDLQEGDFRSASAGIEEAETELSSALSDLRKIKVYEIIPWLGAQLRGTRILTEAGLLSAGAVRDSISFAEEIVSASPGGGLRGFLSLGVPHDKTLSQLTRSEKAAILSRIAQSAVKLERARDRFALAAERMEQIDSAGLFGPLQTSARRMTQDLSVLTRDFKILVPILKTFPKIAGFPEESRSLILFLNNAELRPGGGFIGALGELVLSSGEVAELLTVDSYSIDGPAEGRWIDPAPLPIRNYLGVQNWYLRDANWSPDFAVSAGEILRHLEGELSVSDREYSPHDFVIGFTPDFAADILRITGPITVDDQTFTSENLFAALEYQVEIGFAEQGIPKEQRKEILASFVEEVAASLGTLPLGEWSRVLSSAAQAISEKQLMFWSRDPEIQGIFEREGWAGRAAFGDKDFFMVVDSNMAALKSDVEVQRAIEYSFAPQEDGYLASVSVKYRHDGGFDWKTTRYRTYTRLYLPEGSKFVAVAGSLKDDKLKNPAREPGPVDVTGDLGAAVFGTFIAIEPGEERALTFTFKLSPKIVQLMESGNYELRAVKQPGAKEHDLTLNLNFGKKLEAAIPAEASAEQGDSSYKIRTKLSTDRIFRMSF